jgi:hypothetical protein
MELALAVNDDIYIVPQKLARPIDDSRIYRRTGSLSHSS